MMKVSVAMTSYNGERYIQKQLDSLRLQSYKPDEVIIFDDKSQDSTAGIITEYIHRWGLDNWKLYVNKDNSGWINNFHRAIKQTTGDIIFFCDQDDIWKPDKISIMLNTISKPGIEVLACRLSLMDQNDIPIDDDPKRFPFHSMNTGEIRKNEYSNKFLYTISPGCTLAVKREIIDRLDNLGEQYQIPHDALYWKIATLCGTAYIIDLPLIKYRIHENNTSAPIVNGAYTVKSVDVRKSEALKLYESIKSIICVLTKIGDEERADNLVQFKDFCEKRLMFLSRLSMKDFVYIVKYCKYYNGYRMLIGDCLSKLNK